MSFDVDDDITNLLNSIDSSIEDDTVTPVDINAKTMFSKSREAIGEEARDPSEVDLSEKEFPKVKKTYLDKGHTLFDTTDFYKAVLSDGGDTAKKLHQSLTKFLTTGDPKDRTIYRQQVITDYWNFISDLSSEVGSCTASKEKKYAIRYGMILPTLLTPQQKDAFSRVNDENDLCVPIYYLDEWFESIGEGKFNPSATDEVRVSKRNEEERFKQLFEKASGRKQSNESLMRAKSDERARYEDDIRNRLDEVFAHDFITGLSAGVKSPYTEMQKRGISKLHDNLRKLLNIDRELTSLINEYKRAEGDMRSLENKLANTENEKTMNLSGVATEFETIRQMAKMTCGRQGNHFPVLSREYLRSIPSEIGIRENILKILAKIEKIDPEVFCRQYRSQLNRIPPFVILIPSYGDIGFCWEPFDRYNRITSRGRIAVPMYAKNITATILRALADLRWQVAKEKASYYWMEEGLTGNYYQWYQNQKLKGDIKEYFIEDYMNWILKESGGIQKLSREVRDIFWRYMPFSQEIKEDLKKRAPVYHDLYQKDLNRMRSDGY
ncbi:MAG: hypothetical protein P1P64_02375 [Treponemataceae bacterium]